MKCEWRSLLGAVAGLLTGFAVPVQAETTVELTGVWAAARDFGPSIRGPLTVTRGGDACFAEIAGVSFAVNDRDGTLSFELDGDRGAFSGRLDPADGAIRGHWVQPPAIAMFGQRFAAPVTLRPLEKDRWRGAVRPLPDRVELYAVLQAGGSGSVGAFLRNPQVNFGRFFNFTDVRLEDGRVLFRGSLRWSPDEIRILLDGPYRNEPEMISLFVEDLGGSYDFRRLAAAEPSDYYPRGRPEAGYRYRPPAPEGDGWRTADLASVGLAVAPIEALVTKIIATPIDAIDAPYIDALLIARGGRLVVEEYFHGFDRRATHDTRSASKSITTTLAGALIAAGASVALDTPVYSTMGGVKVPDKLDRRATRITLEHLLTMTSGLACDDWDSDSPGNEDTMQNQDDQPDWYRYTLDLAMIHEPGAHAAYCSGGMNLAGGVMARALGRPLTEVFRDYLARPLDIDLYHANLMPTGDAYAGGGLRLRARDFAKFGQLLLDDGVWNGRRVLAPGWSAAATKGRNVLNEEGYGYGWWTFEYALGEKKLSAFYAGGNGGQYVIGVPELELLIVFMGSNYNQSVQHRTKYDYVPEFILPAVADQSSIRSTQR